MALEKIKKAIINVAYRGLGVKVVGGHLISYGSLDQNSTTVDLGGNLGNFSKSIVEAFNCRSYCIEPNPILYATIPETDLLKKVNAAVSNEVGEMEFFLSGNAEASSFNKKIASVWGITNTIKVKTYTLSELKSTLGISNIDLLKVDIEGAELELFESLKDEELLQIPQITAEFHDFLDPALLPRTQSVIKRFQSLDFQVINYSSQSFAAVLFLNQNMIKLSGKKRIWFVLHNALMNIGRKTMKNGHLS